MDINALLVLNGVEITEQTRKLATSHRVENNDLDLASGHIRRYAKPAMPIFDINWTYIPNASSMTIDLRAGRDYIYSLVSAGSLITARIQSDGYLLWKEYQCIVSSYNERLIRNDLTNQCRYYDMQLQLTVVS